MRGKVVAITGASRGIGEAAARAFAAEGARVVLIARSSDLIEALSHDIGGDAVALACDMTDAAAVARAFSLIGDRCGGLDVLIGNAGVIDPIARIGEADPEAWSDAIDVNLKGVFYGLRAAIPMLRMRGGGTVITVSSGAASNPLEGWGAYCASKAGALMLTRVAHVEEAAHGLRVMGLSPGTVATDMQVTIRESGVNPVSKLDPSAHVPPDWPAKALVWMCSPAADPWLGQEVSLREERVRRAVGLRAGTA